MLRDSENRKILGMDRRRMSDIHENACNREKIFHKGVSFAHKRKKTRKLNNVVLIDANSLTQNMSLTIGVFSFCVKIFRCRSPPKFKFKQKT